MALVVQAFTFLHQYIYTRLHPTPSKSPEALKVGVISSAQINAAAREYPMNHFINCYLSPHTDNH